MDKGDGYHTNAWYIQKGNATLAAMSPRTEVADHAATVAKSMSNIPGTEEDIGDAARTHVLTKMNTIERNQRDDLVKNTTTVGIALSTMDKTGKYPTSFEELFETNPEAKAAYDALPKNAQQDVLEHISKNAEDPFGITPENQALYNRTMGALKDPTKSTAEIDAALKVNPSALNLPNKQRLALFKAQQAVQAGINDSDLADAWATIQRNFPDSAPKKRTGANATPEDNADYNTFIGALDAVIQRRQQDTKQFTAKMGRPPSEMEIRQNYAAHLAYQELYAKKGPR